MKNVKGFIFAVLSISALWLSSCSKDVKDVTTGFVEEVNDSVLIARVDGDKIYFDVRGAQYTNGAVMFGDSVAISYVGNLSNKRAVAEIVRLLPKPSPVIEAVVDTTKELKTREADPKDVDAMKKMIKVAEKYKTAN